jgi:hypothetical protein
MGVKSSKGINLSEWIRTLEAHGLNEHDTALALIASLGAVYGPEKLTMDMARDVAAALKIAHGERAVAERVCEEIVSHLKAPADNGSAVYKYVKGLSAHGTPVLHHHLTITAIALAGGIRHSSDIADPHERASLAAKAALTAATPTIEKPSWFTFDNLLKIAKAIFAVVGPLLPTLLALV